MPKPKLVPRGWLSLRTLVGPTFCIAGLELMPVYYPFGVFLVYVGLAGLLMEVMYDPVLLARSYRIQVVLIWFVLVLFTVFTIAVPLANYPIHVLGYIQSLAHQNGDIVDGIPWQSEFTEVKIIVWNETSANYENLDVFIHLDGTAVGAALVSGKAGECCRLDPPDIINGEAYIGHGTHAAGFHMAVDGKEQRLQILASDIYRLTCRNLPPYSSIGISFLEGGMNGETDDLTKVNGIVIERGRIIGMGPISSYERFDVKKLGLYGTFNARFKKVYTDQLITLQ